MKKTLIAGLILLGSCGSLGFIFNSLSLIYFAQGSVSAPIALVFDSPRNYSFWTNAYDVKVKTSKKTFQASIDRSSYGKIKSKFPNSIVSNAYLIPAAMFPLIKQEELSYSIKYNFCRTENFHDLFNIDFENGEIIESFTIEVSDRNVVPKTISHQRTFKCLF